MVDGNNLATDITAVLWTSGTAGGARFPLSAVCYVGHSLCQEISRLSPTLQDFVIGSQISRTVLRAVNFAIQPWKHSQGSGKGAGLGLRG